MTGAEQAILAALARCHFDEGSCEWRFMAEMRNRARDIPDTPLTRRQRTTIQRFAHRYRRQLGRCMAEGCAVCGSEHEMRGTRGTK